MQKTQVIFLHNENNDDLFAFFPGIVEISPNTFQSYAHIGQHSPCHIAYAKESKKATPEQYKDLAAELESIGYNLEILTNL